ncbi:MAG: hypothetical protein CME24_19120 [Gemmatimonadetes bacterium]|nr:hypothetical protein [Gemmatimonadota bacterium]|tara:strand:+ start:541 stop:987 length:447 start_codon:yes stop_codon:yes gene_type:complete
MKELTLVLEGHQQTHSPAPMREGDQAWVPLELFAGLVGCSAKLIGDDRWGVCRDDDEELCVPLGDGDQRQVNGTLFGRLAAFGDAVGLQWFLCDDDILQVGRLSESVVGLGVGDRPPRIQLPEDGSGDLVSSDHVIGKPAAFYMWASW